MEMLNNIDESSKHAIDAASIFTAVGSVLQWLPEVAAVFTIIWTGIRIYETNTVQKWVNRRKENATKK